MTCAARLAAPGVNNGVSNALKFTERGGSVRVRLTMAPSTMAPSTTPANDADGNGNGESARVRAWEARIEVIDSGMGLTPHEREQLLKGDAFTQVGRGMLQGNGGTGLGLTIVRSILQQHGPHCRLGLDSRGSGQGTTFSLQLLLPAAPDAPAPDLRATAPTASVGSSQLTFPPDFRVLHVEDDAILRSSLALRVFKKLSVQYEVAEDGEQAVEMVRQQPSGRQYALILMDNQMPRMRGDEATRTLRADGYDGVIIGMTGDPRGSVDRAEFESAGLTECLDKDTPGIERIKQLLAEYARAATDVGGH
mmetsp:Transcript_4191/g.10798  ORF Transcript_4191/g.10798 Transcript_4191/m.10798 type:complete len:307 (-) Transcript_4191:173-1093(-)